MILPITFFDKNYYTQFDGFNEYVDVGSGNTLNFDKDSPFSVSMWINPNVINVSATDLIDRRNLTTNNGWVIALVNNEITLLVLGATVSNMKRNTYSFPTTNVNDWYNIIFTVDATTNANGISLYINGLAATSLGIVNTLTLTTLVNANCKIGTGRSGSYFDGKIDKVKIYNKELNQTEVNTIYNYRRRYGLIGIGNEVAQWEMDALNPVDVIGVNNGTSINMNNSNIIQDDE